MTRSTPPQKVRDSSKPKRKYDPTAPMMSARPCAKPRSMLSAYLMVTATSRPPKPWKRDRDRVRVRVRVSVEVRVRVRVQVRVRVRVRIGVRVRVGVRSTPGRGGTAR